MSIKHETSLNLRRKITTSTTIRVKTSTVNNVNEDSYWLSFRDAIVRVQRIWEKEIEAKNVSQQMDMNDKGSYQESCKVGDGACVYLKSKYCPGSEITGVDSAIDGSHSPLQSNSREEENGRRCSLDVEELANSDILLGREQRLAQLRLRLALAESERDELEYKLLRRELIL